MTVAARIALAALIIAVAVVTGIFAHPLFFILLVLLLVLLFL